MLRSRKYLYAIQSDTLEDIKDEYTSPQDKSPGLLIHKDWIPMFAKYLKKLKKDQWHNSFDDLPDKKNLPPENTFYSSGT